MAETGSWLILITWQGLDIISPKGEPGEGGQVVGDLHGELGDVVIGGTQGDDGGWQRADRDVAQVIAVLFSVEISQTFYKRWLWGVTVLN